MICQLAIKNSVSLHFVNWVFQSYSSKGSIKLFCFRLLPFYTALCTNLALYKVFFDNYLLFEDLKSLESMLAEILDYYTQLLKYCWSFFLKLLCLFFLSLYPLAAGSFHKMMSVDYYFDYFLLSFQNALWGRHHTKWLILIPVSAAFRFSSYYEKRFINFEYLFPFSLDLGIYFVLDFADHKNLEILSFKQDFHIQLLAIKGHIFPF